MPGFNGHLLPDRGTDRPRPRDALADLLWPDNDPEHARGALRRTLSTLRGGVGGDLIEATRDHVHLIKGPTLVVDVDRFRHLRESGDLEQAVAVFRGEFLEGFGVREAPGFEDWVRAEADVLRRELTAALADIASARETTGDPAGAVQAVRRWLSLDPLHEPAHRALIRLYAASGDRAAALVQYRDCVRTLSRELGVPPLAETTLLYDAINRGTPAALPSVAEPSPPPPSLPTQGPPVPLVGRADDMRVLLGLYEGIGDDGRAVVIEGEAGIGKTRLAHEWLEALRRLGARVLVARAYEDEGGLPFAPIVETLRARLAAGEDWLTD
ncbi:MAG: BTAD domain-containing putative transcriptional regulator, partial [Caulobacteraceae bacterium]